MRIIDTHLHLIYPERFAYPWLLDAPALNKPFRLEDYWAEARALGVTDALHMEVDVALRDLEEETRFAADLPSPIVGAISSCRPETEDFDADFARLAAIPGVKGFRRILHTSPDELSQTERFAANVRQIGQAGLPFDLCVLARQLNVGRKLVERCPDVQFVLDHCGVPDIAGQALEPWRTDIAALARLPNVAVKLSGLVAYAGPDWTVDDLRPYAEHVIERFGFDRIVWGSDAPVCTLTAGLTRWVDATHALLSGCSAGEKERLLSANAARIYRI